MTTQLCKIQFLQVLANLWEIENEIYRRLGQPIGLKSKCDKTNIETAIIHWYDSTY